MPTSGHKNVSLRDQISAGKWQVVRFRLPRERNLTIWRGSAQESAGRQAAHVGGPLGHDVFDELEGHGDLARVVDYRNRMISRCLARYCDDGGQCVGFGCRAADHRHSSRTTNNWPTGARVDQMAERVTTNHDGPPRRAAGRNPTSLHLHHTQRWFISLHTTSSPPNS